MTASRPTSDLVVIRGISTRYAIRCDECQALKVGVLDPPEICDLLSRDVRIIGDADLDSLITPADTADLDNPPIP